MTAATEATKATKVLKARDCATFAWEKRVATKATKATKVPLPEPARDAPLWQWRVYFDDQIHTIRDDLRAEGTSLTKVEAELRAGLPVPSRRLQNRRALP